MKIKKVTSNNRKRAFVVETSQGIFDYPYSRLTLKPAHDDRIARVWPDQELGREGFTYQLESGAEATVMGDQILEYHKDPDYLREVLLYKLTIAAQKRIESRKLSKREITRRLGTTPTQLYRLMDQTFYGKTIDQMIRLLAALDCEVDLLIQEAA